MLIIHPAVDLSTGELLIASEIDLNETLGFIHNNRVYDHWLGLRFRLTEFGIHKHEPPRCGGVVVICSPHDPEVPSSNPGKNNTSDFSIRDPLSLPRCDWYRIYLAMWWNSSVGRAADLIYTCQVRCRGFDSRCFPHI